MTLMYSKALLLNECSKNQRDQHHLQTLPEWGISKQSSRMLELICVVKKKSPAVIHMYIKVPEALF